MSIEISGHAYRVAKKLPAMDQFHVTRRLGPALVICGVTFKMMMEGAKVTIDHWAAVAGPVLDVVSHMSDDDVEYVINKCMGCVERQENEQWAPVMTPGERPRLMYADIDMAELLRLTVEVLRLNLENFAKGMSAGGSSTEGSGATVP